MSDGLNKVMLIGNLGTDPVHKVTTSNTDITEIRVATTESWRGQDGNRQEQTEWHRVVAWGKQAIFARDYLTKGQKVYIEGKIKTRKWTDEDGKDHYMTEIVANRFLFLDSRNKVENTMGDNNYQNNNYQNSYFPQGDDDDDIPF